MADLPTAANIKEIVSLFAPGMILLALYSRVQAGPKPDLQERLLGYAVASTVYYATVSPVFYVPWGIHLNGWLWSLLQFAFVPVALGWLVAFGSQKGFEYKLAKLFGLQFSHHIPAAWDFTFNRLPATFVLATLKGGSRVGGRMDSSSFASSSKDERDLLIEDVWIVDEKGTWTQAEPPRAVLLCGGDIHYIEIF